MPKRQINLSLDFSRKDNFPKFEVKQFDSLTLNITQLENGVAYSTSNCKGKLYVGVDGEVYKQDTDITVNDNNIVINVDRNMLNKEGTAYAEVELSDNLGIVTSGTFIFKIVAKIGEGSTIPGNIDGFVAKYEKLISEFKSQVNNAVLHSENRTSEMINNANNSIDNKINDIETRFQTLTTEQQQDAEVIEARDNEISLKARLDRDLAKGKIINENVEGSYITVNDSVGGSISNIEILGNTIQDTVDLKDIKSVGTKQKDGLYKMSILSCGKNLFDINKFKNLIKLSDGYILSSQEDIVLNVKSNTKYILSSNSITYEATSAQRLFDIKYLTSSGEVIGSSVIITEGNRTTTLTTPSNCKKLLFTWWWNNNGKKKILSCQLEEGTVATTYESYQENKSSILLPCQLEKVGDVADRLFRREDGVWCVEKSIESRTLDASKLTITKMVDANGKNRYKIPITSILADKNISQSTSTQNILSTIASPSTWVKISSGSEVGVCSTDNDIIFCLENVTTVENFKILLNNARIIYSVLTPQIIELPLDTQITLNSLNGITNIFTEDTIIEPTIKATIPKSLGASVNSLVNKTDILSDRVEAVEKLKEGTELSVSTDKGYVVVENSNNGQIEGLKIEGKTLVNLVKQESLITKTFTLNGTQQEHKILVSQDLKPNTDYTLICECTSYSTNGSGVLLSNYYLSGGSDPVFVNKVGLAFLKVNTGNSPRSTTGLTIYVTSDNTTGSISLKSFIILEGDFTSHTQNPPSYFEGLKSVGDGVDKIEVLSRKEDGNLFDINSVTFESGSYNDTGNSEVNSWRARIPKKILLGNGKFIIDTSRGSYKPERINIYTDTGFSRSVYCYVDLKEIELVGNEKYIKMDFLKKPDGAVTPSDLMVNLNLAIYKSEFNTLDYQSNKKQILFKNSSGTYEKSILRSTGTVSDSIEKHSDGKYYFHKRCEQIVLNGDLFNASGTSYQSDVIFSAYIAVPLYGSINTINCVCDKFSATTVATLSKTPLEGIATGSNTMVISIAKSKLSTQDLTGFKKWLSENNVTVVYQLATEEIYECVNLDLDSYEGETSVIFDGGVISPKLTFKIASHIANTIQVLKDRINYLEDKVISMFKSVLAGDVQSLAYALYPEDFEIENKDEEIISDEIELL